MSVSRRVLLTVAANRAVTRLVNRYGMRMGAARFIAGETMRDALAAVQELNRRGLCATLDHLGESVVEVDEARRAAHSYVELLDGIAESGVDSNVSLKLTQMGLDISMDLCLENMRAILERARQHGNFVRIDMEDSAHVEPTFAVFKALWPEYKNFGLVIQAYLFRAVDDVAWLSGQGVNLRLVKGAYAEPPSVAYPKKSDVDANMIRLVEMRLVSGVYTAIATHDERVIAHARRFAAERNISRDRFEFQMLYGIRTGLQWQLVSEGYKVRVYVPFGKQWYPYFVRRLAERPANLLFFVRSLFAR